MSFADALVPFSDPFYYWWIPVLAVILDAAIGDPPAWPHPVRAVGALLACVEPRARRLPVPERIAGAIATLFVLLVTWAAVRLLLMMPFAIAMAAAVYLSFSGLALGQLYREGRAAVALLEQNNLEGARAAVGMLVSRDVGNADHDELCRVLAETLSENLNDAFVAPFFWLAIGGPMGLWLYKAASTMDSMWGYPHEPWTRFGIAAARLDDVLAFIPARLTAGLLRLAVPRGSLWPGTRRVAADARTMKSPNAGWPMAACAWLHGAAMGGRAVYAGMAVEKPILGPPGVPWTTAKLTALCATLAKAGFTLVILLSSAVWCIHAVLR